MFSINNLGESIHKGWETISDGWNHLIHQAGNALTHFSGSREKNDSTPVEAPHWGLMSAEVFDESDKIVVRMEIPGMTSADFDVSVQDNVLNVSGEKRFEREKNDGQYHLLERAYGRFSRSIPLNYDVDANSANADYKDGVLRLELLKKSQQRRRKIEVQ